MEIFFHKAYRYFKLKTKQSLVTNFEYIYVINNNIIIIVTQTLL